MTRFALTCTHQGAIMIIVKIFYTLSEGNVIWNTVILYIT